MKTTQIHFEDNLFEQLQKEAQKRNITISELIQELVQTSIKKKPAFDKWWEFGKIKILILKKLKKAWR